MDATAARVSGQERSMYGRDGRSKARLPTSHYFVSIARGATPARWRFARFGSGARWR